MSASASRSPDTEATIDLRQALARGARHPLAERAVAAAAAEAEKATASQRLSRWPTAAVNGFAERTDALARIETPIGTFATGDHERGQLQVALRLPVLNRAAGLRASADAMVADGASFAAARMRNVLAMAAAHRYFDTLVLMAQLSSVQSLLRGQHARLERIDVLFDAGRVLKTDRSKMGVEVAQTTQDVQRLEGRLRVARLALAQACGSDVPLDAAPLTPASMPALLAADIDEADVLDGIRRRSDIVASQQRALGLSLGADAIGAEQRLASVDIVVQHVDRRGIGLLPRQENSVALQISIPLFNGSVAPRQRALLLERDAEQLAAIDAERGARLEYERLKEVLAAQSRSKALAAQRIESATQMVEQQGALYEIGRRQLDDVLAAEVELESQKASATIADIEIVRAQLELHHALGAPMDALDIARPRPD